MDYALTDEPANILIDPEADDTNPDRKFPDPEFGPGLITDYDHYFDPAQLGREIDALFATKWLIAGRTQDVAEPGQWFTFDIGPESLIISRASDGELRAFYNVCQHRGARLVLDDFGRSNSFVCGFHSWAWELDGTLKRITDEETFEEAVICDRPGLPQIHVDTWGGFVFVSMAETPPSLAEFLGPLPQLLANYQLEDMVMVSDFSIEWPVNWKVALDAFMEGYHIHRRHPEGLAWIEDYYLQHDFFDNGHSRMILPVGVKSARSSNPKSLTAELTAMLAEVGLDPAEFEGRADEVRAAIQKRKLDWAAEAGMDFTRYTPSQLTDDGNYFIFPNTTFNMHAEGFLMMRFRPHPSDPEKCFYDVSAYAHRVKDPDYRLPLYMGAPDIDLSGVVPRPERVRLKHGEVSVSAVLDQDSEFVPFVQAGMKSRGFKKLRLSRQERRIQAFYQEYERCLSTLGGTPKRDL